MGSFVLTVVVIFIASILDVGLIELIIYASGNSKKSSMLWVLTAANFIFGFIVGMFFSIIGGVCAIANTEQHIIKKMSDNSKK